MKPPECPPIPAHTRRGWVVNQLLRSIFTGEFRGGDRLVEIEVAATLNVSRTPIREAFSELSAIGLIALKPNHGAIVRPFGPTQIREIYHVRGLLEAEATRLAAARINLGSLYTIREATQQCLAAPRSAGWTDATVELDRQLHELVAESCGSARLAEEISRYRGLVQAIRVAVGNNPQAQEVAMLEHTRIMDALLARDAQGAARLMAHHIQSGTLAAIGALFRTDKSRVQNPSVVKIK